jgi:acyl-CoA hydrolase
MLTESMMYLTKKGVVTGKIVAGFALGSNDVYTFAGECPQVFLSPIYRVNRPEAVAKYDNFVSINSCLMADITGQVASEGIGTRLVSATGGASDYVRGATASKGGQSFICLPSTTEIKGEVTSNIVAALPPGTPVTVQRSDVQYIVTEYGIADVYHKSIQERIRALISVAHPDFRGELTAAAVGAKYITE